VGGAGCRAVLECRTTRRRRSGTGLSIDDRNIFRHSHPWISHVGQRERLGVLLIIAVPLLVTVIVGYALWRRGARRGAGPIAWTFTGLLAGFNLVAMLSIGPFIMPVTASLAFACTIRQARPHGEAEVLPSRSDTHRRRTT
jgi:hypothetical protein